MLLRTGIVLFLCITVATADDQPNTRKEIPEKAILGHWKTLAQEAEFFIQPDGRFVANMNGEITDRPWQIIEVDAEVESVKILVDPGKSQVEYMIRLATGQQSCIAQETRSQAMIPQRRSTTWVYVDDRTAAESKRRPALRNEAENAAQKIDRSSPPETMLVGHWITLFDNGSEHYFSKNGTGCMTGCGIHVYQDWNAIEQTQQEKEKGTLQLRRFSPGHPQFYGRYTLHFASDGNSLLMESFAKEKREDSPYRYSRTWHYADSRTDPKQELPKP